MQETIGTGKVELYPIVDFNFEPELRNELAALSVSLLQLWRCGGRPPVPDPLKTSLRAQTNLHIYYPSHRFKDKAPDVARSLRKAAVTREGRRLLAHCVFRDSRIMNLALQAKFGSPTIEIPWQKILGQSGPNYSLRLYSFVEYQYFGVSWPGRPVLEGRYVLCLPVGASHRGMGRTVRRTRGACDAAVFWQRL